MDIQEVLIKFAKKMEILEDKITDMEINLVVMFKDMINMMDDEIKKRNNIDIQTISPDSTTPTTEAITPESNQ